MKLAQNVAQTTGERGSTRETEENIVRPDFEAPPSPSPAFLSLSVKSAEHASRSDDTVSTFLDLKPYGLRLGLTV